MTNRVPKIFSRSVYRARQAKASADGTQEPMLEHVAGELKDRLSVIKHTFTNAAVIAQASSPFVKALSDSGRFSAVSAIPPPEGDALQLEALGFDAVFSLLDLQSVNDVPGYLVQCARALRPDGLFMACFFAGDTLVELRQSWLAVEAEQGNASPRIAPMIDIREMGGLLQRASLALPVVDSERLTLRYGNTLALLKEIKAVGYANPLAERRKSFSTGKLLANLSQHYEKNHADEDGRIRATLELFWALAWKPHESQQQPKRPGSATVSLADVLNHEK